jgi:DNA-directed RNA polymerase subunit beta
MPDDLSILPAGPAAGVFDQPKTPDGPPAMRRFGDALATRKLIYDNTLKAAQELEPLSDDKYTLSLKDVGWADPERFSRKARKKAVLGGETLARRMHGTWEMTDNQTGEVVDSRKQVVARVPYLTSMGTFVHRGNDYAVRHQQRLLPGVYARVMDNGELESHVNVEPGHGPSHRYFLDPASGLFKLKLAQAEMPLLPLLHAMGATDQEVRKAWGDDLYASNYAKADAGTVKKLAARLLRDADPADEGGTRQKVVDAFAKMKLDPQVTSRTLGAPHAGVTKDTILAATRKLLAINKGEADPDDRDSLVYQTVHGPEDLFAERIRRDHGRLRKQLFRKLSRLGSLAAMPSGALTPQLEQVLHGSGLAQALEEVNPLEVLDRQSSVTRMGEGGIPSHTSIPTEARQVQPSHTGYLDLVRTPESESAGVDLYAAAGARKGADGQLYRQFTDKAGKLVWKTPRDVADAAVATPDVMSWGSKRVPVVKGGKLTYVPKSQVDYVVPDFESAFSPLANLVPFKSAALPNRLAMGTRYLTQALPLVRPEAPLVQSAVPGTNGSRSFAEELAPHVGAVRARQAGRVEGVGDGLIHVRYDDGTRDSVELYENLPYNRKTAFHQTPAVRPGQAFPAGGLLATSNFTDAAGVAAPGLNARVAYMAHDGLNFEDAVVVSQGFADRTRSEQVYQHGLEPSDRHKLGKRAFVGLFPATYDKAALAKLDENGVVRPGTEVAYGEPLILAAKERSRAQTKLHKKRQPGYADESVVWEHHDPGVVTDVAWGKGGPVVVVKSAVGTQVGDKVAGMIGDKGVISKIVPDEEMPRDADGKPFEVLLGPDSITTRGNPMQMVEAALGKLARKLGRPLKVPDFDGKEDLTEWALDQLRAHNVPPTETVTLADGRKVQNVGTGVRYLLKLVHTAESKGQGRGAGAYDAEDAPAKGGPTGCFTGDTPVHTYGLVRSSGVPIGVIVENRLPFSVPTVEPVSLLRRSGRVTDWFARLAAPADLVTLTLADGETLSCTRNHEFVLADGTRKAAGMLAAGDDLLELR